MPPKILTKSLTKSEEVAVKPAEVIVVMQVKWIHLDHQMNHPGTPRPVAVKTFLVFLSTRHGLCNSVLAS